MSEAAAGYRVNHPNVVGEEFDGEIVAVNLETGTYFSLAGSAGVVWGLIGAGAGITRIEAALRRRYDCSGVDVAAALDEFLDQLLQFALIVPAPPVAAPAAPPASPVAAPADDAASGSEPFRAPRVEAFSDLQDILLLDPIHDVDEAGWPVAGPLPPA